MVSKAHLIECLATIKPRDALEKYDLECASEMLTGGSFGVHAIAYAVILDEDETHVLLVHHRETGLWLPCGGHIEDNEAPADAASRELLEELDIRAEPVEKEPVFLNIGPGESNSTHINFWFAVKVQPGVQMRPNANELAGAAWFPVDDLTRDLFGKELERFLIKYFAT